MMAREFKTIVARVPVFASAVALSFVTDISSTEAFAADEFTAKQLNFFENRIRPVLIEHCLECHSGDAKQKGGLNLSFRGGLIQGGESGPAIVPGKPEESLLIEALRYESFEMPPKGRLPKRIVEDFETWVSMGAPDPRKDHDAPEPISSAIDASELWSFQPVTDVAPPEVKGLSDPIDRFIRKRLLVEGITPAGPAALRIQLRRLYLDLTGLPPTADEIAEFESGKSFEEIVDHLLGSAAFGERFARHWLDLTSYADTIGVGRSIPALEAWRYRDYVIDAFNADKPFDEFIRQQIAGDIQVPSAPGVSRGPEPTAESIIATGFLAIGPWELVGGDKVQLRMDVVDRQVNRVGKAFLGMTFECARCHEHKFDPVSQKDYYALAGLFKSTITLNGRINGVFSSINQTPLPESSDDLIARAERVRAFETELAEQTRIRNQSTKRAEKLRKHVEALKKEIDQQQTDGQTDASLSERLEDLKKQVDEASAAARKCGDRVNLLNFIKPHRTRSLALSVMDAPEPEGCSINIRGNAHLLGDPVPRGFPGQIAPTEKPAFTRGGSGRVQLADWLTDERNPLTARVWVNRVWHYLFGAGLVRSVDNFGARGEQPDHPELLDYLASEFMKNGWSTKQLVRRIVLSETWRQSSVNPKALSDRVLEIDPENRLLWRANRQRLDAEVIRDSMLKVSDRLDGTRRGPSLPVDIPGNLSPNGTGNMKDGIRLPNDLKYRRTIYLPQKRKGPFDELNFLAAFDLPDPNQETGSRNTTTVPTQALYLLNSRFVLECASFLGTRIVGSTEEPKQRVQQVYRAVLGRVPSDTEVNDALYFVSRLQSSADPQTGKAETRQEVTALQAWSRLCQTLLISNEFLFRD